MSEQEYVFSDRDLRRLKEHLAAHNGVYHRVFDKGAPISIDGIYARLAAAEKVIDFIDRSDGQWTAGVELLFSEWRKAAGKERA